MYNKTEKEVVNNTTSFCIIFVFIIKLSFTGGKFWGIMQII